MGIFMWGLQGFTAIFTKFPIYINLVEVSLSLCLLVTRLLVN